MSTNIIMFGADAKAKRSSFAALLLNQVEDTMQTISYED